MECGFQCIYNNKERYTEQCSEWFWHKSVAYATNTTIFYVSSISESNEIVFAIILIQTGTPRQILFTIAHQIFIFASQIGV